jgi:hypothetical protein
MSWFITFTDDYSHETHVYLMATKDQALEKYKTYEAWVSTQHNAKIKSFQNDNSGEYINAAFKAHLQKQGTRG